MYHKNAFRRSYKMPAFYAGERYSNSMKIIKKDQARLHKNSRTCVALEYPFDDKDINAAIITITGRYPEEGYVVNKVCKEAVYIIVGTGILATENTQHQLAAGDMAMLPPGEKYYFEGNLQIVMPCHPAWYPEQHEEVW